MQAPVVTRPRIRTVLFAALLIFVGAIGAGLVLKPTPFPLLRHANRVADVGSCRTWWWLDARRLFVVEDGPSGAGSAFVLDVSTGQRVACSALNRTLSALGRDCSLDLSPDGKWLAAMPWTTAPRTHRLIETATGKTRARYNASYFRGWLPDSSGWVGGNANKAVHGENLFKVDGSPAIFRPLVAAVPGAELGFTASGNFLVGEYNPYSHADLKLHEIDGKTGRVSRLRSIALPDGWLLSEVSASPDRKRMALQMRPQFALPAPFGRRETVNAVWVCDADGSGMKYLGELPVRYGTDYDCDLSLESLPDSKHIAVDYKGTLYTIPAG